MSNWVQNSGIACCQHLPKACREDATVLRHGVRVSHCGACVRLPQPVLASGNRYLLLIHGGCISSTSLNRNQRARCARDWRDRPSRNRRSHYGRGGPSNRCSCARTAGQDRESVGVTHNGRVGQAPTETRTQRFPQMLGGTFQNRVTRTVVFGVGRTRHD
jgi:hypothetical protein